MTFISPSDLATEAGSAAHNSGNLGACVLAADVPFSGMGLDIFNRRVQGVSWKSIADEFNLGTPSKARSTFTKLTGITDYQIKGPQLLKLAQGGLDDKLTISLKAKKAMKASKKNPVPAQALSPMDGTLKTKAANQVYTDFYKTPLAKNVDPLFNKGYYINDLKLSTKQYDFLAGLGDANGFTAGDIADLAKKLKVDVPGDVADYLVEVKKAAKVVTHAPDVKVPADKSWLDPKYHKPAYDLHKQGHGYLAIQKKTGLSMDAIDKSIWNHLLDEFDGDVWKAYKAKPGSQEGFNTVKEMVFAQRKAGKTVAEVADITDVDPKVVKAIVDGNWKLPSPGMNQYYVPPSYSPSPSAGSYAPKQNWGSTDFPRLSDADMAKQGTTLDPEVKTALKKYTGGYYHTVNGQLRGLQPQTPSVMRDVAKMDRGMQTTKMPMTVSRGMDREGFGMGHLSNSQIDDLEGLTVRDRGFMSTSTKEVFDNEIRLILEVPAGAKGYWVQPFSNFPNEKEFLLSRDTKIMITKVEQTGSGYYKRWKVYGRVIV